MAKERRVHFRVSVLCGGDNLMNASHSKGLWRSLSGRENGNRCAMRENNGEWGSKTRQRGRKERSLSRFVSSWPWSEKGKNVLNMKARRKSHPRGETISFMDFSVLWHRLKRDSVAINRAQSDDILALICCYIRRLLCCLMSSETRARYHTMSF